jgi:hypothetical protein
MSAYSLSPPVSVKFINEWYHVWRDVGSVRPTFFEAVKGRTQRRFLLWIQQPIGTGILLQYTFVLTMHAGTFDTCNGQRTLL